MKRIAIFASGNGSNFQAIAESVESGALHASIEWLFCDHPGAYCLDRAKQLNIPVFSFQPKDYPSKEDFEQEILQQLQAKEVDLIVLAGYMRMIGSVLLTAYPNKIINIHPSLLPSFPGKNAVLQAIETGASVTGVTIHYVDAGMDTGPIIAQSAISIHEGESLEDLHRRIQHVEHDLYPKIIEQICNEQGETV
jgi:phosphoribosylglycinamide formyltransferase-1